CSSDLMEAVHCTIAPGPEPESDPLLLLQNRLASFMFTEDMFFRLAEDGSATAILARGLDYSAASSDDRLEGERAAGQRRVEFLTRLFTPVTVKIQTTAGISEGANVNFLGLASLSRSSYEDVFGVRSDGSVLYPSTTVAPNETRPGVECFDCVFSEDSKNVDIPL